MTIEAKTDAATKLRELFIDQLKDIYWVEKELTQAIPKMKENATSNQLKEALSEHLSETEHQVERLDKVFSSIGSESEAVKCVAMVGLEKEGEELMQETEPGAIRDAAIIAAAQKIEHYEIATYGTLCAFAKSLNENESYDLMTESLDEEKAADKKLTKLASDINEEAMK
ncbi:MAG: ferritin-like domain-containing protein [Balneolaceae bacterium]